LILEDVIEKFGIAGIHEIIQTRFCWNHFDMVYVVAVHHHDKKVRIPSSGGLLFSFIEPNIGITLIIYTALCSSTIWLCVIPG